MHKLVAPSILAACLLATAAQSAGPDKLSIAVYGDSPYGTSNADTAQFSATPAFIKSINADPDVSLVFHVGDIHSGQQQCTLEYDQSIHNAWNGLQPVAASGLPSLVNPTAFRFPVIYTPGDNEWTDCQKTNESRPPKPGTADPIQNLGSEYWTYLLPRRVAPERARNIIANRLPVGVRQAANLGLIDDHFGTTPAEFRAEIECRAMELANDRGFAKLLRAKHQLRMMDEAAKPLESYRQEELERMRLNFFGFDSSYHVARYNFVHRLPRSRTPLHLATHRARTLLERTPVSTESVRVKKALIDDRESA